MDIAWTRETKREALFLERRTMTMMNVLVTGASGYVGGRLVPELVRRGHSVRCMTRDPKALVGRFDGVDVVAGDALADSRDLAPALSGIDAAYYLVHSMGSGSGDFADRDRRAARNFALAARAAGIRRIIYLGGLGDQRDLSHHLESRHEVGRILRESGTPVTEFRAGIIIGSGSSSFEIIRYLTERLPVMIAPRWVSTRCQPIAIADVIAYLVAALDTPVSAGRTYEIGGSDRLTYRDLILSYARARGLRRRIIDVPLFTPRLSSYWVHLVTPVPASIARPLIDGLKSEVIVRDRRASTDFSVKPMTCDESIAIALDRYRDDGPQTTWFDAFVTRTNCGEFRGTREGVLVDRRETYAAAPPDAVFRVCASLGGARGWLYADWLWRLRAAIDRLFGGPGMGWGRRSATTLRIGDVVDFWRVEALEANKLLRLRATMRLPGRAWLEFAVEAAAPGSRFRMTAFFEPRGLMGQIYWWAICPLHYAVFNGMSRRIVEHARAERRAA